MKRCGTCEKMTECWRNSGADANDPACGNYVDYIAISQTAVLPEIAPIAMSGTIATEREALERAFRLIHGEAPSIHNLPTPAEFQAWEAASEAFWSARDRFTAMLDAEAYLSAAEMLVSDGVGFSLDLSSKPVQTAGAILRNQKGWTYAPTPALALTNAILKARGLSDE